VVAEELEGIVQLLAFVMRDYRIPPEEIEAHEATLRGGGYRALRGEAAGVAMPAPEAVKGVDMERTFELRTGAKGCTHLGATRPVTPSAGGCEDCLRTGDTWVHLRLCMTCGHVGCCDSSKNKHATGHHRATGHPIVKSLEPGEDWGWCYVDQVEL